ncbi:hypothetical protein Ahy_A07g035337 [Arachis hypogaea]|uniref:TMV resistance protein N n=1 Tax=Arachis hypogaea TaxID=3818 RepID=A0A445CDM3_ARAHY|nr:hypothetical protein Ahy_A07g035337 [Arachis hypogaea]
MEGFIILEEGFIIERWFIIVRMWLFYVLHLFYLLHNTFQSLVLKLRFYNPLHTPLFGCSSTTILGHVKFSSNEHDHYLLPGDNYPDWLTFNSDGASIIFNVPHGNRCDLKTMTMCIVYSSSADTISLKCLKNVLITTYTKSTIQVYKCDTLASLEDDEWQSIISSLEPGDRVEIVIVVYGT